MVDVGAKPMTDRRAVATSAVHLAGATLDLIESASVPKGSVLATAELAGIQGAKRTSDLIPLCHPLELSSIIVRCRVDRAASCVEVRAEVQCTGRTGVEMEARATGAGLAVTTFGSYFARFQKNTKSYFLTDQSVPWWAICFTVVATETSTLTFIGVPASAYAGNWTFLQLATGYVIGRIIVTALFLPRYFRGAMVTSYQLLQQRFGGAVNSVAAGLFLFTRSLADGIRLYVTALAISIVTGVPVHWAVQIGRAHV